MIRRLLRTILFITILLSAHKAFSQAAGEPRLTTCSVDSLIIRIDTLSIVPGTFVIPGTQPEQYRLDPIASKLYILDSALLGRVLVCHYQVFNFDYAKPILHRPLSQIEPATRRSEPVTYGWYADEELYDDSKLLTSGFVSRGVTVGNNQDPVLNSALNLQLSGNLTDDIRIAASISDKNIPIQPEGNTQYLSNINNIFITLYYKDMATVDAGDIAIQSPESHFLSLSRNLLGIDGSVRYKASEGVGGAHALGGGVAKGSFVRQKLAVQNGVQGPYKLYGANNEVGIVIVAGSERVYVDGVLLTRGQENDYVMDYNAAEITFTPAQMMSAEKRVFVEFEYTDRHYTRIGLFSYNELLLGKKQQLKLNVNYYEERDLKNQSIQPELGNEHKRFLSLLGDDLRNAYYPYADSAEYTAGRLLYCKKDTVVNGIVYQDIYEYSTDEQRQLYSVGFTYMGPGQGSYVLLRNAANGRVFGWVAPQNGELQGDYAPVLLLSAPQSARMATIQASYRIRPSTLLQGELALSHYDRNLFSKSDDGDNVGFASTLLFDHRQSLKRKGQPGPWEFLGHVDWQFVHRNFHAIESFREVEFARNYNLENDYSSLHSEQMLHAIAGFTKRDVSTMRYEVNWFTRIGNSSALRQELASRNRLGRLVLDARASFLTTSDTIQKSRFLTADAKVAYRFRKIEVGAADQMELNLFRDNRLDSLRINSYAFNEALFYLKNGDSSLYKYNISYKNRIEYAPDSGVLRLKQTIQEASALFQFDRIKNQRFSTQATYRTQRLNTPVDLSGREHYFVGKVEYTGRFFRDALLWNTYYEVGSCMEQKRTYTFLKVATGKGTHVWRDYNGNGVEEMDEFEVAAFQDEADYVKVWITGTEYVNAYQNGFTQSVQLRPVAVWGNKAGFRRFLARFSDVALFRTQLKHTNPIFNPFYANVTDTNLVGRTMNVSNTFSFNNSSSKFAFDFIVQKSQNKALLYYGFEQAENDLQQVVLKSSLAGKVRLEASYTHSVSGSQSDYLSSRDYEVERHAVGGKVRLQFQDKYIGELSYGYGDKTGRVGGGHLRLHDANASFDYKLVRRGVLSVALRYVAIQGELPANAAASYQMLEGLAVGNNAVWTLNGQLAVSEYLQVSLQYEGRASQGHKVVHTGGLTLRAQF